MATVDHLLEEWGAVAHSPRPQFGPANCGSLTTLQTETRLVAC